jgi:prephenate dehydratase
VTSPTLAFAGERGSFGEDAALAFIPGCRLHAVATFREVFGALEHDVVDGGVVPIENVGQGTVREVYDLMLEHDLAIVGEVEVPVRLCLAALPGQSLDDITRVYSHPQALSQAEPFLAARSWTLLASTTTASGGASIARRGERGAAAVLSPRAAQVHGLEVLAADIQSLARNRTRFLVLAHEARPAWTPASVNDRPAKPVPMRSTICFTVTNAPGTLLRVLEVFARHAMNMSKLESRPDREGGWEYVFWVDLDTDVCAPAAAPALDELRAVTVSMRVIGSYPAGGAKSATSR